MTRKELETVLKVLGKIKNPDSHVLEAIFIVNKQIEMYNGRKGQLIEQYEYDESPW